MSISTFVTNTHQRLMETRRLLEVLRYLILCDCPHDNSKTNHPKVFKLDIWKWNDLGIAYKSKDLRSRSLRHGVIKCKRRSSAQPLVLHLQWRAAAATVCWLSAWISVHEQIRAQSILVQDAAESTRRHGMRACAADALVQAAAAELHSRPVT